MLALQTQHKVCSIGVCAWPSLQWRAVVEHLPCVLTYLGRLHEVLANPNPNANPNANRIPNPNPVPSLHEVLARLEEVRAALLHAQRRAERLGDVLRLS